MGHWFLFAQNSLLRVVPHPNAFISPFLYKRETERQRETGREIETERDRERQRETERDRESQRETERVRERQRETERETDPLAHTTTHHQPNAVIGLSDKQ